MNMKQNQIGKIGLNVTQVGLGTGPLGGLYAKSPRDQAMRVLERAWDHGIRYFDTAPFYGYGLAERRVGDFLQGKDSDTWRLSTKVGRLLRPSTDAASDIADFVGALKFGVQFDYSYDGIMRSVEDSYARLGLTNIDIAYIHDIGLFTHAPDANAHYLAQLDKGGFRALDTLKSSGAIRAWGIGVNEIAACHDILARVDLDCILLAGRYTLLDRTAQADLLPLCRERGVSIVAGGVFNSGILATGAVESAYFDYQQANDEIRSRVKAMQDIAEANSHALARPALHFPLNEPLVASMLLGTDSVEKLDANMAELSQQMTERQLDEYSAYALTK